MAVTVQNVADIYGQTVDTARVIALIADATTLCQSYINPLPAAADVLIKNMVIRAYANPTGANAETVGPVTAQWGASSAGLYLTRRESRELRRLNNGGGAFSIDPTPAAAAAPYGGFLYPEGPLFTPPVGGYIP